MIISKPTLNIVATILAKNEEDIIGKTIEHHIEQGVSRFIVTDNASTDRTAEIAAKYPEVSQIIDERGEDHRQSEWVTRMAREACRLKPDWIIHLDADEHWCGLNFLRRFDGITFGSTKMYLHPPRAKDLSYYLDFESIQEIPGECKVGHRPDPEIVIAHGNHGIVGRQLKYTKMIWRHHFPVRSYAQFERKAIDGHLALSKRNAICERWKKWYDWHQEGKLESQYSKMCETWDSMIRKPNLKDLLFLLESWSTSEVQQWFYENDRIPEIGQWLKGKL
jgi:glycosyltransferase involved in cell wall biosynthesis